MKTGQKKKVDEKEVKEVINLGSFGTVMDLGSFGNNVGHKRSREKA